MDQTLPTGLHIPVGKLGSISVVLRKHWKPPIGNDRMSGRVEAFEGGQLRSMRRTLGLLMQLLINWAEKEKPLEKQGIFVSQPCGFLSG